MRYQAALRSDSIGLYAPPVIGAIPFSWRDERALQPDNTRQTGKAFDNRTTEDKTPSIVINADILSKYPSGTLNAGAVATEGETGCVAHRENSPDRP